MTDSSLHPSLRDLLSGLSTDIQLLVAQTVALARIEASAAVSTIAWSAVAVLVSALVATAGVAVLVGALVLILIALGLPAWAAATLVGVVLTLGGALTARHFVNTIREVELGLTETRRSVRETLEWLTLQTGS